MGFVKRIIIWATPYELKRGIYEFFTSEIETCFVFITLYVKDEITNFIKKMSAHIIF